MVPLSEEEAKDLVQAVFIKFWNDREKINLRSSVRSYLFVSVKNKCFDSLRKKDRNIKLQGITGEHDVSDDSYETYILSELDALFKRSLNKVPDRCREIFELSRFQGLKIREIAVKLNLSEKTVENQITNALRILKEELKDYLPLLALFDYFHFLS